MVSLDNNWKVEFFNQVHYPPHTYIHNQNRNIPIMSRDSTAEHGSLPESVIRLLQTAQFLHLATCANNIPHVSLMNYTYVPEERVFDRSNKGTQPYIVLTTGKNTQKYENMVENPNVSLLVHDWVTAKENTSTNASASTIPESSKIFHLLQSLNQNEFSSLSATLNGVARIIEDKEEAEYYKKLHLENCSNAKVFIDGDNVSIILVEVLNSKVADSDNNVSQYN